MTPFKTGAGDALIVGASRGVGLALTRQLLELPPGAKPGRVFATYRGDAAPADLQALQRDHGERLQLLACELSSDAQISELGSALREARATPGLVIHAAGILHEGQLRPEKALQQAQREVLLRLFNVNAIAPLLVAQTVLPLMPRQAATHFAALSAMVGSISDNRIGGWYGYRASKAALNQLLKTLAIEARRTHPGLCVTAIHPGTTDTDLSRPFQGNVPAGKLYTPAQSAERILEVILSGRPDASGRFMNWNGQPLPW
jgi:NAD(P)-dependent dehydrogenase (short-subunit alcohol dehydrogenase family)